MTTNMNHRTWVNAFRENNRRTAGQVAAFLRSEFNWITEVSDEHGCIYYIENDYGTWEEDMDDVEGYSNTELIDSLVSALGMSPNRLAKIDMKFSKTRFAGSYTKMPLPKDIAKEKQNVVTQ